MSPKEYHCGNEDVVAKNKFDPSSTMWNKQSRIIIVVTVALIVLSTYMQKTSFYKKLALGDKVASNTSTVAPLNEEVEVTSASEPRGFRKFWRSVKHRFQRKRNDSNRRQIVLSDIVKSRVEKVSKKEMNILLRTKENAMDIQQASMLVPWGGPGSKQAWWSDDLIAAYLIIMKFPEVSHWFSHLVIGFNDLSLFLLRLHSPFVRSILSPLASTKIAQLILVFDTRSSIDRK